MTKERSFLIQQLSVGQCGPMHTQGSAITKDLTTKRGLLKTDPEQQGYYVSIPPFLPTPK